MQRVRNLAQQDPGRVRATSNVQGKTSPCRPFLLQVPLDVLEEEAGPPPGGLEERPRRGKPEECGEAPAHETTPVLPSPPPAGGRGDQRGDGGRQSPDDVRVLDGTAHTSCVSLHENLDETSVTSDLSLYENSEQADTSAPPSAVQREFENSVEEPRERVLLPQQPEYCSDGQERLQSDHEKDRETTRVQHDAHEHGPACDPSGVDSNGQAEDQGASGRATSPDDSSLGEWGESSDLPIFSEDSSDPGHLSNTCRQRERL